MLTQEELKESLHYNPETGIFTWIIKKSGITCNSRAGYISIRGYEKIKINGKLYSSHRLAWLYMNNKFPAEEIDHINGNTSDNRIINLRDISKRRNQGNRAIHRKGKLVGAVFMPKIKKWRAQIMINKEIIYLGYFFTEVDANNSYKIKLQEIENERK